MLKNIKKHFFRILGSSRKFGENETIEFIERKEKKIIYPAIPLHPHNNSIQILAGVRFNRYNNILPYYFGTKYYLDIILVKMFVHLFPGSIISIFLINQSSYGIWQTWWISSICLCLIFLDILCLVMKILRILQKYQAL